MSFSGDGTEQADCLAPLVCESLVPQTKLGRGEVVSTRSECVLGGFKRQAPRSDQDV